MSTQVSGEHTQCVHMQQWHVRVECHPPPLALTPLTGLTTVTNRHSMFISSTVVHLGRQAVMNLSLEVLTCAPVVPYKVGGLTDPADAVK